MRSSKSPTSSALAQQVATKAAFFLPGFAAAVWAVLVPFAKARTGADDGMLGLLLLCLGAGALLAMLLAGVLAARFGCRPVMQVAAVLMCAALPLLAVVSSPGMLGLVLFMFGASLGGIDCAMNMQAVVLEREAARPMMSGFHAFFSIGGFVGAAYMALLLGSQLSPEVSTILGALAMAVLAIVAQSHWRSETSEQTAALLAWPQGVVLMIGIVAFIMFLAEGAMLDWSAVFLTDMHRVAPSSAGLAYLVFSLTMTLARLFGDSVVVRLGRPRTMVLGAGLACAGFLVITFVQPWQASLLGYGLVGLGCANIVPALFSMAGLQKRMPEASAITAVTTLGYLGVLAGPALIGFVAHSLGLASAFLGMGLVLAIVAIVVRWIKV